MAYPGKPGTHAAPPPAYSPTPQSPGEPVVQGQPMQMQPQGMQQQQYQQQPQYYQQPQGQPQQMATHPQSHVVVMQQPQPATHVTVVSKGPEPVAPGMFGRGPAHFTCSYCGVTGYTRTNEQIGGQAWCWVFLLCLCFWPLAWVPLVTDSCKETTHYCPSCNRFVARVV